MDADNMPMGFLMTMAQNPAANAQFNRLSPEEQEQVVARAREAHSRREMRQIVQQLGSSHPPFAG